jgi:hypothetical protein
MKLLRPGTRPRPENPDNKTTRVSERPLRICVVFDEDASGRSAEILIRHVASDYQCDTQSFRFDELNTPAPGVAAARSAADTDILLLAARGDRMLPTHIRLWLGLCLGLRDKDQEGALVAMITQVAGTAGLHSSIVEYLETVAIIGGLAFFPQQLGVANDFASNPSPSARRQMRGPRLNSSRSNSGPSSRLANHGNCKQQQ